MKNFQEMNYDERAEVSALLANWLEPYTHEVIVKVLERRDEIISNDFVMNLLRELKKRDEAESKSFANSINNMLGHFECFSQYDPHNHCLEHAGSYHDVLYDMYIREI